MASDEPAAESSHRGQRPLPARGCEVGADRSSAGNRTWDVSEFRPDELPAVQRVWRKRRHSPALHSVDGSSPPWKARPSCSIAVPRVILGSTDALGGEPVLSDLLPPRQAGGS